MIKLCAFCGGEFEVSDRPRGNATVVCSLPCRKGRIRAMNELRKIEAASYKGDALNDDGSIKEYYLTRGTVSATRGVSLFEGGGAIG